MSKIIYAHTPVNTSKWTHRKFSPSSSFRTKVAFSDVIGKCRWQLFQGSKRWEKEAPAVLPQAPLARQWVWLRSWTSQQTCIIKGSYAKRKDPGLRLELNELKELGSEELKKIPNSIWSECKRTNKKNFGFRNYEKSLRSKVGFTLILGWSRVNVPQTLWLSYLLLILFLHEAMPSPDFCRWTLTSRAFSHPFLFL